MEAHGSIKKQNKKTQKKHMKCLHTAPVVPSSRLQNLVIQIISKQWR